MEDGFTWLYYDIVNTIFFVCICRPLEKGVRHSPTLPLLNARILMNAQLENEMPPEGQNFKTITTSIIIIITITTTTIIIITTTTTNTTTHSTLGNACCSQYNNYRWTKKETMMQAWHERSGTWSTRFCIAYWAKCRWNDKKTSCL